MLHISLGGKGTEILLPSARTAFPAAPSSHLLPAETLSAERKKSRRLGAISGSNGWSALRRLRQSHLFGGSHLDMLRSNSSEQLCLSAAGGANCRSKNLCTVWPSELVMRARSRARRRCCGTVARWDRLHVSMAPEEPAGGHGGALPLACPYCLGSEKRTINDWAFLPLFHRADCDLT